MIKKIFRVIRTAVTTVLAILGLAGIADSYVKWRGFFENEFFVYYKEFKLSIIEFLNLNINDWVIDYTAIGIAYASSFYIWVVSEDIIDQIGSLKQKYEKDTGEKVRVPKWAFILLGILDIVGNIIIIAIWPLALIAHIFMAIFVKPDEKHIFKPFRKNANLMQLKFFVLVILLFGICMFVFVDFERTL